MFIRLTSKDAPLMGPFHTLISLKVKRWHNSNLQRENVKCSEQWFKNTFTRLFISLLATHYGRIAILVHLGLALCLDPALASSSPSSVSQPGMFHGQLQTHISSSKNVPSWCLGSYTIEMSISFHLTGLEPSMTHLALAKGVFTGSLMSVIYRRQMKHWGGFTSVKSPSSVHTCSLHGIFGCVVGYIVDERVVVTSLCKYECEIKAIWRTEYLNQWHGRGLSKEEEEKENHLLIEKNFFEASKVGGWVLGLASRCHCFYLFMLPSDR